MATAFEKSLAVESMHRLAKHISDSLGSSAPLSDEVIEIHLVWDLRDTFAPPMDLNACLARLRTYRKPDGTLDYRALAEAGWEPKGRRGLTTG